MRSKPQSIDCRVAAWARYRSSAANCLGARHSLGLSVTTTRRSRCVGDDDERPQRVVHSLCVRKNFGNIWVEEHHVCAFLVPLVILSANGVAEVVFRKHVVIVLG